ncbi:Replication factor C subunit 3 [Aphelenchoides besseyi]|nr:Replication factor C subunit 3 [Aphelenchoides besseyi]KAI6232121.1 Replication factor C subunit 3 [Aphelenchoides besseyi]
MALWADKYRPKQIDDLDYNVSQLNMLKQMVSTNDFPHLLFVGPDGCGKRTRIHCLLNEIYGQGIYNLRHTTLDMETASGKPLKVSAVDSKYHIEICPSDAGYSDRIVVQQIIKNIAGTVADPTIYKKPFRVVLIDEADLLSIDAQQALRRTMEKYAGSCKLFLCCTSLNKILDPVISRCMVVRLPAPSLENVVKVLKHVGTNECLNLSDNFCALLAKKCDRNLRRCVLTLEMSVAKHGKNTFYDTEKQIVLADWRIHIQAIAEKVMARPDAEGMLDARKMLYEIINRLIPMNIIFEYLTLELAKRVSDTEKWVLYNAASKYQHMSIFGEKPIVFLEAFLLGFLSQRAEMMAKK